MRTGGTCSPGATNSTQPASCCANPSNVCVTNPLTGNHQCFPDQCQVVTGHTCAAAATRFSNPASCCSVDDDVCVVDPSTTNHKCFPGSCQAQDQQSCTSSATAATNPARCCASDSSVCAVDPSTGNHKCFPAACMATTGDAPRWVLHHPANSLLRNSLNVGKTCDPGALPSTSPSRCCANSGYGGSVCAVDPSTANHKCFPSACLALQGIISGRGMGASLVQQHYQPAPDMCCTCR